MKKENKNLICDEDASQLSNDVYNKTYTREKIASRFAQSGRSMIEMLGVLSIIGVLSVGGYSMVKKMQDSYDTNKVMDEIATLVQKARMAAREGENIATFITVPDGVVGNAESGFDGTANVSYAFSTGGSGDPVNNLFGMTISGLSDDLCIQVAIADWGNASSSGFKGIKVNNYFSRNSYSMGDAASKCSGNNNTIILYYR